LIHLTKTAARLPNMWGFDTENFLLITGGKEIHASACKTPLRSAVVWGVVTVLMPTEMHVACWYFSSGVCVWCENCHCLVDMEHATPVMKKHGRISG